MVSGFNHINARAIALESLNITISAYPEHEQFSFGDDAIHLSHPRVTDADRMLTPSAKCCDFLVMFAQILTNSLDELFIRKFSFFSFKNQNILQHQELPTNPLKALPYFEPY